MTTTPRVNIGLGIGLALAAGVGLAVFSLRPPGPAPSPPAPQPAAPGAIRPWFEDVTASTGIDFSYRNGEDVGHASILESLGGGVALFDYDGDGLLDVFLAGGGGFAGADGKQIVGRPNGLFKNLGGWRFRAVTAEVGLGEPPFYSHGCAVADFDRDGWPDLLLTGWGGVVLYHNEPDGAGGRRFVDVTARSGLPGVTGPGRRWATGAAWGDLDGDGFPDLYVCQYVDWSFANDITCPGPDRDHPRDVCPPQRFKPLPHLIFRNNGDGTFRDFGQAFAGRDDGKGLGVVIADLAGDGRPDVYVANDAGPNRLYLNRGHNRLEERGLLAGVAVDDHGLPNGSMGVDAGDYDNSGRASLFVTNFQGENHALYQNLGGGRFRYDTRAAGVAALGQQFVGFGAAFLDADNDGWLDLVITNGHVLQHPISSEVRQRPVFLHNRAAHGRRHLADAPALGGPYFDTRQVGRGLAVGDLDNDGWPDLVISHTNGPAVVLRNRAGETANHWLGVTLTGAGRRDLAGATLTLEAGGRRLTRFVRGGGSYLSASDSRVLFGLGGEARPGTLTVRWPWGATERREGLTADRYWWVAERDPPAP